MDTGASSFSSNLSNALYENAISSATRVLASAHVSRGGQAAMELGVSGTEVTVATGCP